MTALSSMVTRSLVLLAMTIGCGSVPGSSSLDASTPSDTAIDSSMPVCDPTARFGSRMAVPGLVLAGVSENFPRLSADELTIYFDGAMADGIPHLYSAHRGSRGDGFGMPKPLTMLHSDAGDGNAALSPDENTLWFASRKLTTDLYHLYVSTRRSQDAEFGPGELARDINTTEPMRDDGQPFLTADGAELWFISRRTPSVSSDVWRAVSTASGFAVPVREMTLSSSGTEYFPTVSADRLTIYVNSDRADANSKGGFEIWRSHRNSVGESFPGLSLVAELNTSQGDFATWISPDNCRIYGSSGNAIFMAARTP